jgi:hypothetical protein
MPRYFFTAQAGDPDSLERVAELSDDAAALAFGYDIVRELTKKGTALIEFSSSPVCRSFYVSQNAAAVSRKHEGKNSHSPLAEFGTK